MVVLSLRMSLISDWGLVSMIGTASGGVAAGGNIGSGVVGLGSGAGVFGVESMRFGTVDGRGSVVGVMGSGLMVFTDGVVLGSGAVGDEKGLGGRFGAVVVGSGIVVGEIGAVMSGIGLFTAGSAEGMADVGLASRLETAGVLAGGF